MSDLEIQMLMTAISKLETKVEEMQKTQNNFINEWHTHIDVQITPRINQLETDVQDLTISLSKTNVGIKKCQEDEKAKLDAITTLIAPAVDLATDTKEIATAWEKIKDFIVKNWKWIVLPAMGVIGAKYPELAKWLTSILKLVTMGQVDNNIVP
jgi:seryl-tRNA synthetase